MSIFTRLLNVIENALSIGTGYEVTCRLTGPSTSMALWHFIMPYRSAVIELLKERLRGHVPLVAPPIFKKSALVVEERSLFDGLTCLVVGGCRCAVAAAWPYGCRIHTTQAVA